MVSLHCEFPWVHNKFANEGYHTVKRSSRFWKDLWTDLTIGLVIMKSIKSRRKLIRGQGLTESVKTLWTYTLHCVSGIHEGLTGRQICMTDLTG